MRIGEYKIVDYKVENKIIPAQYDEEMNLISEERIEEIKKPIMALVYRDMTEEEIAQMQAQEIPQELPSAEERIEILEQAFAEFVEEVLVND